MGAIEQTEGLELIKLRMETFNQHEQDSELSEQSCYTCGRQLTLQEVACGDGNCESCFEKQNY